MKNIDTYYKLILLQKKYPKLTFDNNGYEYLDSSIKESHKEIIVEIENILNYSINRFVKFNNFKPRKDGSFDIRCQYMWNEHFTGVGYFKIKELKHTN